MTATKSGSLTEKSRLKTWTAVWVWGLLLCASGCATMSSSSVSLPDRHALVRDQLVVHSDFELSRQHRLLNELTAQRSDLLSKLELPASDEPIHIYLFDTPDRLQSFLAKNYPDFPERRAFFVESDTRLDIYAQWGDRVAEDLRHEMAHAYLHAVVRNIPLWMDEGLAEYFEVTRGYNGLNALHIEGFKELLASGEWRPDLKRLEGLHSIHDMTQTDYAESWAWVHWLLESYPTHHELLRNYMRELMTNPAAVPFSERLTAVFPQPEALMEQHLQQLIRRIEEDKRPVRASSGVHSPH